jgi:hypothetical protein
MARGQQYGGLPRAVGRKAGWATAWRPGPAEEATYDTAAWLGLGGDKVLPASTGGVPGWRRAGRVEARHWTGEVKSRCGGERARPAATGSRFKRGGGGGVAAEGVRGSTADAWKKRGRARGRGVAWRCGIRRQRPSRGARGRYIAA